MANRPKHVEPVNFQNPQFTETFDDKPLGKKQSQTVHVPSPRTTFNLGEWVKDLPVLLWNRDGTFGFPGASLMTEASLFVSATKESLFNLVGGVVFQTKDKWQQWADGDMLLKTKRNLGVFAEERLFIATGLSKQEPEKGKKDESRKGAEKDKSIPEPGETKQLEDHKAAKLAEASAPYEEYFKELKEFSEWGQKIAGVLNLAKTLVFFSPPKSSEKWLKLFGSKLPAVQALKDSRSDEAEIPSSLDLYGAEGISIFSPAEISMGSKEGVKIFGSKEVALTGGEKCEMSGGVEAKLFGGFEAGIDGGLYADVRAGREVAVAALHGPVEIKGARIEIGNETSATTGIGKVFQSATCEVAVKAYEEIALVADNPLHLKKDKKAEAPPDTKVHLLADKIEIGAPQTVLEEESTASKPSEASDPTKLIESALPGPAKPRKEWFPTSKPRLEAAKEVAVEAREKVLIRVGDYQVEIRPDGITIGDTAGKDKGPLMSIDKAGEIKLESKGARVRLNDKGGSFSLREGNAHLSIHQSGTVINGKKINIG